MGIGKDTEYTMLKEEVLGLISIQNNYIIAMYTITVTIIAFAIERNNEWLFLLPYIILFSFQRIISAKNDNMVRIAAYIVVFLEDESGWETLYKKVVDKTTVKHNNRLPFSRFMNIVTGRVSTLQLGALCSLGAIITNLHNNKVIGTDIREVKFMECLATLASLVLFVMLYYWCKNALKSMSRRETYIESLRYNKSEILS